MKHHRFIGIFDFSAPSVTVTDPELLHQWRRVLRLKPGDEMILVNQDSREARVRIADMESVSARLDVLELYPGNREPSVAVHLYCSVLKRENFELVVQKATEVGVTACIPVISTRTIKLGVRTDRMNRIAKEAAEQCGRAIVPVVEDPLTFDDAVARAAMHGTVLFFDIGGRPYASRGSEKNIGVFIGPEGGWDDREREAASRAGFITAGLGDLILRAETAAIVASYSIIRSGS